MGPSTSIAPSSPSAAAPVNIPNNPTNAQQQARITQAQNSNPGGKGNLPAGGPSPGVNNTAPPSTETATDTLGNTNTYSIDSRTGQPTRVDPSTIGSTPAAAPILGPAPSSSGTPSTPPASGSSSSGTSSSSTGGIPTFDESGAPEQELSDEELGEINEQYSNALQNEMQGIDNSYTETIQKQGTTDQQNSARVAAMNANNGVAGSGMGAAKVQLQNTKNQAADQKVMDDQSKAISDAIDSSDKAQAAYIKATNTQDEADYKEANTNATNTVKGLGKIGLTASYIQQTDPQMYNSLLPFYNNDPNALAWALQGYSTSKTLATEQVGDKTVIFSQDGAGNVTSRILTLPAAVGTDYDPTPTTIGDNIVWLPKDPSQAANPATWVTAPITPSASSQASTEHTQLENQNLQRTANGGVTSGTATFTGDQVAKTQSDLEKSRGKDGFANTAMYVADYKAWTDSGAAPADFFKHFPAGTYINPADPSVPPYILYQLKSQNSSGGGIPTLPPNLGGTT